MVVALTIAYAVPAAAIVVASRADDQPAALGDDRAPVEGIAQAESFADLQTVQATPGFDRPVSLLAPAWSGTVTAAPLAPGDPVAAGTVIAEVDGIRRVAYTATRPLYRVVVADEAGPAVADLRAALAGLGYLASPARSDAYDAAVVGAVARLARDIGAASDGTSFDPSWLVWSPVDSLTAGATDITAGAPAPAPGSPVVTSSARLTSITLTRDGASADLPGRWRLSALGVEFELVDGVAPPDGLAALDERVDPGGDPFEAQVSRVEPRQAVTVAAGAVLPGGCIWIRTAADHDLGWEPQAVTVAGSGASSVAVTGIDAGTVYLANPGEALEDPSCP